MMNGVKCHYDCIYKWKITCILNGRFKWAYRISYNYIEDYLGHITTMPFLFSIMWMKNEKCQKKRKGNIFICDLYLLIYILKILLK